MSVKFPDSTSKGGDHNGQEIQRQEGQAPLSSGLLVEKKLNIGCGGRKLSGYVHLDRSPYSHVEITYDLESGQRMYWDTGALVADNTFDRMLMSHVIEHIRNPLPMMQELHRVAKPGCKLAILAPYGSSDNAWEDPTHVRAIFMDSMMYFSQAWYEHNDYGYRGDWQFSKRLFVLHKEFSKAPEEQLGAMIQHYRNMVVEFQCELVAVKPIRKHPFEFDPPQTAFKFA